MSAPFEKIVVKSGTWNFGTFKVFVWPHPANFAPENRRFGLKNDDVVKFDEAQRKFIEDAIREKLEREANP